MLYNLLKRYLFAAIFVISVFIFLAHTYVTKTAIFADGRFYYTITRSIVKDFDIKFANEYEKLGVGIDYTNKDYVWNKYPPGTSIFWIPLFWIFSAIDLYSPGFGLLHQTSIAITQAFLTTFGLYLIFQLLQKFFSEKVSLFTIFTLFSATNILFYSGVEPINSHAISFFISSLFVYYFLKHQKDKHYYLILGLLGGAAGLIRTQDLVILILPTIKILTDHRKRLLKLITCYLLLITGFAIGFLPQVFFWYKIFGNPLTSPYLKEGFDLLHPHIIYVLSNTQNGLFTITPIIAVAVIGLLKNLRTEKLKNISTYGILYFLLQLYLVSSWSTYTQGGSFSIRMLISTYPLLSFGLASIIEGSQKKLKEKITVSLILFFSVLNVILIINYLLRF